MCKMVKDFIEVREHGSLNGLIDSLIAVRDSLPDAEAANVRMRGCDTFGRLLSIAYLRPQTAEEEACDARYADAYRQSRERELAQQQERDAPRRYLRAVA